MIYSLGEKKPSFDVDSVWIADSADLIGDVVLNKDVSVWFNVTMRGDNDTIKVNIDENVTVGHKVIIHGASIGANTVVGMGSVVMNHAKVGANCIIGANSLITERKEFPDNSLIMGSPAKIVRELTEEEISVLVFSAKHYIDKSKTYKAELKS